MTVEPATYIGQLDSALPPGTDSRSEGDDHLRLLKATITNTFPNQNAAMFSAQLKGAPYVVTTADHAQNLVFTAVAAVTLPGSTTVFNGFTLRLQATAGDLTVTPSAGLINGVANITVPTGWAATVVGDAANYYAYMMPRNASQFGTAAALDAGTAVGDLVQLEDVSGSAGLPAVDGSQLTGLPSPYVRANVMPGIGPAASHPANTPVTRFIDCAGTIGSPASGATFANALAEGLYEHLWAWTKDVHCPVDGGRGASASADWAADKKLALPAVAGAAITGVGGVTAGKIPTQVPDNAYADDVAGVYGTAVHTLTEAELAAHTHALSSFGGSGGQVGGSDIGWGAVASGPTGGDQPHNTTQHSIALTIWIVL